MAKRPRLGDLEDTMTRFFARATTRHFLHLEGEISRARPHDRQPFRFIRDNRCCSIGYTDIGIGVGTNKVQAPSSTVNAITCWPEDKGPMKHPEAHCDCLAPATPLALRWRCPVCGKSTIMKVSTLDAVCDGESLRRIEPQGAADQRS
jgi:hypothetical protein